jgi:hypothetical protein
MGSRIPFTVAVASVLFAAACAEIPPPAAPEAKPAAVSAPSASPEPADPAAFVGRGAREIAELLGEPGLKRRDAPAELWQYRAGPCVLDLFLYDDRDGGAATVAHAEVRPREMPAAECLKRVRSASGGG